LLPDGFGHHRAPDPRFCGEEVSTAIQQRLAAQAAGNVMRMRHTFGTIP
jgi:hypothetical protein